MCFFPVINISGWIFAIGGGNLDSLVHFDSFFTTGFVTVLPLAAAVFCVSWPKSVVIDGWLGNAGCSINPHFASIFVVVFTALLVSSVYAILTTSSLRVVKLFSSNFRLSASNMSEEPEAIVLSHVPVFWPSWHSVWHVCASTEDCIMCWFSMLWSSVEFFKMGIVGFRIICSWRGNGWVNNCNSLFLSWPLLKWKSMSKCMLFSRRRTGSCSKCDCFNASLLVSLLELASKSICPWRGNGSCSICDCSLFGTSIWTCCSWRGIGSCSKCDFLNMSLFASLLKLAYNLICSLRGVGFLGNCDCSLLVSSLEWETLSVWTCCSWWGTGSCTCDWFKASLLASVFKSESTSICSCCSWLGTGSCSTCDWFKASLFVSVLKLASIFCNCCSGRGSSSFCKCDWFNDSLFASLLKLASTSFCNCCFWRGSWCTCDSWFVSLMHL